MLHNYAAAATSTVSTLCLQRCVKSANACYRLVTLHCMATSRERQKVNVKEHTCPVMDPALGTACPVSR